MRDRFEVLVIHARVVSAEVVELLAIGDRSVLLLPCESVREHQLAVHPKVSVSLTARGASSALGAGPQMARRPENGMHRTIAIDLRFEPLAHGPAHLHCPFASSLLAALPARLLASRRCLISARSSTALVILKRFANAAFRCS